MIIEDKEVKRYTLDNGVEFYFINDLAETSFYHAYIIRDSEYETNPNNVWQEKIKIIVSDSTGITKGNIIVSASSSLIESRPILKGERLFELLACQKCGASTPKDATYCTSCGDLIP